MPSVEEEIAGLFDLSVGQTMATLAVIAIILEDVKVDRARVLSKLQRFADWVRARSGEQSAVPIDTLLDLLDAIGTADGLSMADLADFDGGRAVIERETAKREARRSKGASDDDIGPSMPE